MNEFTVLREHGPEPTPLSEDVLAKARAELMSEIGATAGRPVRLRRRAAIVVAAAAAAAIVAGIIATNDTDTPPTADDAPPPSVPALVRFDMPTLPPVLTPIPDGMAAPGYTAEPGWLAATYHKAGKRKTSISVSVRQSRPDTDDGRDTTYAGKPAVVRTVDQAEPEYHSLSLAWEWSPGRWISLTGYDDFADEQTVRALADTLVDTDEQLRLDITVAPAGWELFAFKDGGPDGDGAVTSLRDPRNPDRMIHVSTMLEMWPDYGKFVQGGPVPVIPVTINDRAGELVHLPDDQWMLQAPLPDGRAFHLQVPAGFTQQQVVELAEGVN